MKKLFLISALLLGALTAKPQANAVTTMTAGDTATNSTPKSITLAVAKAYQTVSVQYVATKLSGTVAGYAYLSASVDGTNYVNVGADSLTLANQTTNTKAWVVDNSPYSYFRVTTVGTGTMSASVQGYVLTQPLVPPTGSAAGAVAMTYTGTVTTTTITNTATRYHGYQVRATHKTITIQPVITKVSGTVAGTVTLQGSNDGTNYETVPTSYVTKYLGLSSSASSTFATSNQTTNTCLFVISGSPFEYYRVSYTGSGTMSATMTAKLVAK
jgi:hypothetical protein